VANFINYPERFASKTTKYEFNIDKANELLDKAGWKKGADGIREKDGKKLKFLYQTSINQPRQKTQAIVKQACQRAGIEIEVKAVTAAVFFSSDVANPDTYPHFYADLQMYNNGSQARSRGLPAPVPVDGSVDQGQQMAGPQHHAPGRTRNMTRRTRAAQVELDPVKRAALLIKCNELAVNNRVVIPGGSRGPALPAPRRSWSAS